jgi:nitroreductase
VTDLSTLLNRHRSIRSYKADPIPTALVEQVLGDAVAGSSSSGNLNSYSMILTRDPERKRRLYTLHFEQDMVLEAPSSSPSARTGTGRANGSAAVAPGTTSAT